MILVKEFSKIDSDDESSYEITISRDGKMLQGFSARDLASDCPEDATLSRDMGFAYQAIDFFKLGLEIGKSGEEVKFESEDIDESE